MINLETARELKDAGLKWEPKRGDWYWVWGTHILDLITFDRSNLVPENILFAPRLDQLLAELRKHSKFVKITWLVMEQKWCCVIDARQQFISEEPEEAAAQALLWILRKEG